MAKGTPRSIRLEKKHIRAVKQAQTAMKHHQATKLGKKPSEVTVSWDEAARQCLLAGAHVLGADL